MYIKALATQGCKTLTVACLWNLEA